MVKPVMTYPLIGNYGLNLEDVESSSPKVKGLIVQESVITLITLV